MGIIRGDPNARYLPVSSVTNMGGNPAMGILDAVYSAFEATTMVTNPSGFAQAFQEADDENIRKAAEAGFKVPTLDAIGENGYDVLGRDISRTGGYKPYEEFQRAAYGAEHFQTTDDDEEKRRAGMAQRARDMTASRDELLAKAAAARPDLGIELTDAVRKRVIKTGTDKYRAWSESRPGVGANVGGLIGEMGANFDWTTNPWWLTNFMGGAGKTAMTRIMSQFGFGAGTSFIQDMTGGAENARWFGVERTTGEIAGSALIAGAGAGLLQGVGEAITAPIFRPKRAPPPRPAPAPPAPVVAAPTRPPGKIVPMSKAAIAAGETVRMSPPSQAVMDAMGVPPMQRAVFAIDVDHTARQSAIWGSSPGDARPPTVSLKDGARVIPNIKSWLGPGADDIGVVLPDAWHRAAKDTATIDPEAVARGEWGAGRAVDPDTFRMIDKVREQIAAVREQLRVALSLTGERVATNKFSGPGREMWAWVAKRTEGTPETDRLLAAQVEAGGRVKGETGVTRVAKEMQAIRDMQAGGKVPARFDPTKLNAKLVELTMQMDELLPMADRATARAQGEWGMPLQSEVAGEWARLAAQGVPTANKNAKWKAKGKTEDPSWSMSGLASAGDPRRPPKWITDTRTVKKLTEMDPEIPELLHPAALMGAQRNEPKIDTVQRVADARVKEVAETDEAAVKLLGKLADEAAEAARMPDKIVTPEQRKALRELGYDAAGIKAMDGPTAKRVINDKLTPMADGTPKPDPLDHLRERIEKMGDETIMLDDKEVTVKDFLAHMKDEAEMLNDVQACRVTMGWAGNGNG